MTNKLPMMLGAGVEIKAEAVSHFPQFSFAQASHFLTVHKLCDNSTIQSIAPAREDADRTKFPRSRS
jgi:hypothetical protein